MAMTLVQVLTILDNYSKVYSSDLGKKLTIKYPQAGSSGAAPEDSVVKRGGSPACPNDRTPFSGTRSGGQRQRY